MSLKGLVLRPLEAADVVVVAETFADLGWNKPAAQYEKYLAEQEAGTRKTVVAFMDGVFSGYLNVLWKSHYSPFVEERIPEINDFNVLPAFRRRGIGSHLMNEAEHIISTRSSLAGIGVGMDTGYGAAQRLYVLRGYVPDGRGLTANGRHLRWGETVRVDDDLVLYFTKRLR